MMIPSVDSHGSASEQHAPARLRTELDALVLQGGADISPSNYGEEPLQPEWAGDRVRDEYEIELFSEFVEAGKPVLGVCRGVQLINVALGGTLYQDLPAQVGVRVAHRDRSIYEANIHEICFEPGSGLARLYAGVQGGRVNSLHHQAVRKLGRDLVVEARSAEDGVIEAIRWKGRGCRRRAVASEFHPRAMSQLDSGCCWKSFCTSAPPREAADAKREMICEIGTTNCRRSTRGEDWAIEFANHGSRGLVKSACKPMPPAGAMSASCSKCDWRV
jgi:putative glutamine amidotransferase